MDPPVQAAKRERSVSAEAARWNNRLKFTEIQVADRLQRLGERAVSQVVRQAFEPGCVFNLGFRETGDMIGPAPSPAAMIKRATHADDWFAGGARGTIAGLTFGVGHRCFTD